MIRPSLLMLTLLFASSAICGDFDYGSYQQEQLSQAAGEMGTDPSTDYWYDTPTSKYSSVGTFTGKTRPMGPGVKQFFGYVATATNDDSGYLDLFSTEVEVAQGTNTYWMPIQDVLIEPFKSEVPAGAEVRLYVALLGAYSQTPVFVINEFDADGI